MDNLLEKLVHGLLDHLENDHDSVHHGALFCKYHNHHHIRGAEASFPIVFLGRRKGDNALIEKGLRLSDWLVKSQNNDGSWDETPETWTGTSVFQLMALASLVDISREMLSTERLAAYERAVRKACEWVCKNIRFRMATTNYVASGAAALILADKVFPEKKWRKKAGRLARLAAKTITRQGLVKGEGRGRRILKKIYIRPKGIDIGYGLEMTLGSLGIYATLANDRQIAQKTNAAVKSHLFFIFPDGSLDNSIGSRGYKWTIFGSKTAHGSQIALACGAFKDPEVNRALCLTAGTLENYLRNGLLADGPDANAESKEHCYYASVFRAANLAFALEYFQKSTVGEESIPAEKNVWFRYWEDLNSVTLKHHPWMACISGYGEFTHYPEGNYTYYVPGGGALTRLFHKDWGDIQVATQLDYHQIETLHVPFQNKRPVSFAPRIIIQTHSGVATNVHSRKPVIKCEQNSKEFRLWASGHFLSPGDGRETDSVFEMEYIFSENSVIKNFHITLSDSCRGLEIFEPILYCPGTEFQFQDRGFLLKKHGKTLCVDIMASGGHFLKNSGPIHCPLPALNAFPLAYEWDRPEKGKYAASVHIRVKNDSTKETGQ